MDTSDIWGTSSGMNVSNNGPFFTEHVRGIVCRNLLKQRERRLYEGGDNLFRDVQSGDFCVSDANNEKPILSTLGVGTCIAVAGYDRDKKVGFLAHIVRSEDVTFLIDGALKELKKYGEGLNLEFSLVGGMKNWKGSELTVLEIYRYIDSLSTSGGVVYEGLFSPQKKLGCFEPTSLLLDTRNGNIYYYPDETSE